MKSSTNIASHRRIDTSGPTEVWKKHMDCTVPGSCGVGKSKAVLNSDKSLIYSVIILGATSTNIVFSKLNSTNGDLVGNVFASSIQCTEIYDIRLYSTKIYILSLCTNSKLLIYDDSSASFVSYFDVSNGSLKGFVKGNTDSR